METAVTEMSDSNEKKTISAKLKNKYEQAANVGL